MPGQTDILSWLHIGDLHITRAGEENHRDLLRIVELMQGAARGLDFAVLALFVWIVDERGHQDLVRPLRITGMNAIVIYLASEFFSEFLDATSLHPYIYQHWFAPFASPMNASLLWALAFTFLMFLLGYFMYRRSWFVRL